MQSTDCDRPEWRTSAGGHPDARVGRAYANRFAEAVRTGMGHADARDYATAEAERVARERRQEMNAR